MTPEKESGQLEFELGFNDADFEIESKRNEVYARAERFCKEPTTWALGIDEDQVNDARIYCTCDVDLISLDKVCPIHRITLQQAIEGDELPLQQNERRNILGTTGEWRGKYIERRVNIRRNYDRETIPEYQDPLSVLWLVLRCDPDPEGDQVEGDYICIAEGQTEAEARERFLVQWEEAAGWLDPEETFKFQPLSTINFADCAGVFKI